MNLVMNIRKGYTKLKGIIGKEEDRIVDISRILTTRIKSLFPIMMDFVYTIKTMADVITMAEIAQGNPPQKKKHTQENKRQCSTQNIRKSNYIVTSQFLKNTI
jgi:hypothetical protein